MTEIFPAAFQDCLRQILRRAPQMRGARETEAQGRRKIRAKSGTFAGHRAYSEGDDLRDVDWNASARTGELFLKVLEEDDRRTLTVCLDRTMSMTTGDPQRYIGALRLAAILGGLALVQLDGLHLVGGPHHVHSLSGGGSVARFLAILQSMEAGPQNPFDLVRVPVEQGWLGSVVWISDFADPETAARPLHWLRRHGRRCSGWLPSLREDRQPILDGWVRLRDPETGVEEAMEVDAALRQAMTEELAQLERHQDSVFAAAGYPLVRFPLPREGDFRLSSWFTGPWTYRL